MPQWNLLLRFVLELAALVGLGWAGWSQFDGVIGWAAAIVVPLIAAVVWGTFNVPDDPSRSGAAPVVVSGPVRLTVEVLLLAAGWIAYRVAGQPMLGVALAVVTVGHYAASGPRLRWLLSR